MNILIEAGIPAVLFHGNAMGGLGELPVIYPEIWIKRDLDEEKSLLVIRRFETASISITKRDDLLCGSCGEENPASFELCWNCSCALSLK